MIRIALFSTFSFIANFFYSQLSVSAGSLVNPLCSGSCTGSISANVSGGLGPFTYAWTDASGASVGSNSPTISSLCVGDYTVNVSSSGSSGSTTIYQTDFATSAGWTLNVPVAPQGIDPNFFQVSDDEGGVAVGGCGVASNGNNTLHLTSVFFPNGGAAYDAGGLCGFLFCPETHSRAISPLVNTSGNASVSIEFDYIAGGDPPNDKASVWGNDGSGWVQLTAVLSSPTCGIQGLWSAYSFVLPASYGNNPACQFAIQWDNNDDGVGTDPSVAIDNFRIVSPTPTPGATGFATFSISEPLPVSINSISITDASCGTSNGELAISASGGTGSLEYSINNGLTFQGTNTFTGLAANSYQTLVQDANGCTSLIQTATISSTGAPIISTIDIINATCANADGQAIVNLTPSSATAVYSINSGITTQITPTFIGLSAGFYTLDVMDNGCTTTQGFTILNLDTILFVSSSFTDATCGNADGTINVEATSSSGILEYAINGSFPTQANGDFSGLMPGTYNVEVTNGTACSLIQNFTILAVGGTPIEAGIDLVVCENSIVVLSATPNAGMTISWDNGVSDGVPFVPVGNQLYHVQGIDSNGCVSEDSLLLSVLPLPVIDVSVTNPSGCSPLLVNFVNNSTGITNEWNFSNGISFTGTGNQQVTFTESGCSDFTFTTTDLNGCINSQLFPSAVCVVTPPEANFFMSPSELTTTDPIGSFTNLSENASIYYWTFGDGTFATEINPVHEYPSEVGVYNVILVAGNSNGCLDTLTLLITVGDDVVYYVPNSFTPDGNQFNQFFQPVFNDAIDVTQTVMKIYDRWGELIFETYDFKQGWDGTYKGELVSTGSYTWVIEYKLVKNDVKERITGHVNMLK